MRSRNKFILVVAVVLGVVGLSAGIAVAAVGGGQSGNTEGSPNPAAVSQAPGDDADEPGETDDVETGPDDDDAAEGPGDDDNDAGETDDDGAGQDDADQSLTGATATSAADAALAATGGGTVVSSEPDDGDAGYEVEIRKADGSEVEVELDKSFKVVQRAEDD